MNLDVDVAYQLIIPENDKLLFKYLVVTHMENGETERRIVKKELTKDDFIYETIEETKEVVESLIRNNFDHYDCDNDILKLSLINKYSDLIDGFVSNRYDNVYYNITGAYDSPVFILEYENKYAVFKHPNIKNYGFIINE